MFKKLKFLIYTRPFIIFAYYLIQIYSLTLRIRVKNESQWMTYLKEKKPVIICTWHQQFFAAIRYFRLYSKFNPGLMISQSRDGDLISGVANMTGWHTPRGSSSRGGKTAMESMIRHIQTFGFGAHILDGPRGPIGKVKPGIIKMALETNAVIVPFSTRAENAWFFNSWDRFMLPKPFSLVTIEYDAPITLAADPEENRFETFRSHLEQMLLPKLYG